MVGVRGFEPRPTRPERGALAGEINMSGFLPNSRTLSVLADERSQGASTS